jgi:cation/acetate symporter
VRLLWDIQPISAGVFGVPAAFVAIVIVSLLTRAPDAATHALVDFVRVPALPAPRLDTDQPPR